jgi:hypothetical protein
MNKIVITVLTFYKEKEKMKHTDCISGFPGHFPSGATHIPEEEQLSFTVQELVLSHQPHLYSTFAFDPTQLPQSVAVFRHWYKNTRQL